MQSFSNKEGENEIWGLFFQRGRICAILPQEIIDIKEYIANQRTISEPFDIVVILWSEGSHSPEEQQETERYKNAGVTWWLEDLSTERFQSLEDVRERLHMGPPGDK